MNEWFFYWLVTAIIVSGVGGIAGALLDHRVRGPRLPQQDLATSYYAFAWVLMLCPVWLPLVGNLATLASAGRA